jgi:glycosyltransferase involved in cell wall biosynthesis
MNNQRIAAIILTKNEEQDLPACLASLRGLADEVYVIDSGSQDRTAEIARESGAMVLEHPFVNHARQTNWAIENIPTEAGWVLLIAADERPCAQMRRSVRAIIESAPAHVLGVMLARRTVFLGQRLRFGGTFPVWLLRLWRRGAGRCEDRWMDEHVVLTGGETTGGQTTRANGELLHVIPKSLAEWSRKHVWYAERECLDLARGAKGEELLGQAGLVRKAKIVYYEAPPLLRAVSFWAYRYFFRLGFLDGRVGFLYHFLQCAWYRMLVDGMLMEREAKSKAE